MSSSVSPSENSGSFPGHLPLPPLRKYIRNSFLMLVALFGCLGAFLMIAVFLASGITPKLIHLNYDSIAAAYRMEEAWDALRDVKDHPEKTSEEWVEQFDRALIFSTGNISEEGEYQITKSISDIWMKAKSDFKAVDASTFQQMNVHLNQLVALNQKGMFALAAESNILSKRVFFVSILLFLIAIGAGAYLTDNLAVKIAAPLKDLAEMLRKKPVPGSKLKLPKPTSLEMRIFIHELLKLWERLSVLVRLNLDEILSQQKKLEAVLSAVDDAILVLDMEERVLHVNQGILSLIEMKLSDVLGQPWKDLSTASTNYMKLRELLQPSVTHEQTVHLPWKGKKRLFSGRCRSFFGDNGEQIGTLYLLHDITASRQKDRLKTEFIGVLSHELKTPLASLTAATDRLLQRRFSKAESLDEDERLLVDTIHEDVGRIRAVANEFMQVGLVNLHSMKLKFDLVNVSELLHQWTQPFQVLAKDRDVKVIFVKEGSDVIRAKIDQTKFPWAISNLISNAIRVAPPQSAVVVYLTDRESRVDIEVRDEGPGISEDLQQRMFDPGYTEGSGSGVQGIGLTITKEVVESHGGRIEYFSRAPQGSIFRVSLPLPA